MPINCANCMDLDKMQATVTEYEENSGSDGKTILTFDSQKNCFECDYGLAELPISNIVKALDPTYPCMVALKKANGGKEIKRKCYKPLMEAK